MKSISRYIDIVEQGLLTLCFSLLLLLALSQIIARNIFDAGFIWADDAIKVLVLWVAMLGALYATKQAKHINIDIASKFLPKNAEQWLKRSLYLCTSVICLTAAYFSWQFILLEIEDPLVAFLNVPTWVCELIIPVVFLGMSVRFILFAILPNHHVKQQTS